MQLSLAEAAALLGKSERQVRYLIRQGKLSAEKAAGRWVVDATQLRPAPSESAPTPSEAHAAERLRQAAERPPAKRYSVRDLRAYQAVEPLYRELRQLLGSDHPVTQRLRRAIDLIARGCHTYQGARKLELYEESREEVASAVVDLLLESAPADPLRVQFADRMETILLPQLAGLIRSSEERRRRAPFAAFGTGRR